MAGFDLGEMLGDLMNGGMKNKKLHDFSRVALVTRQLVN